MTTADLIDKLYGVKTAELDDPLGVTSISNSSASRILDNDPGGLQVTVINTGASDINLFTDNTVSATKGIRIAANGGSYEIDFTRFLRMPTREWWAIGIGGTTTITVKRTSILGQSK